MNAYLQTIHTAEVGNMSSRVDVLTKVTFPYCIDYIPRRGRKIKSSWAWGSQTVVVQSAPISDLQLAYRINRDDGKDIVDIYTDASGAFWWPVGDASSSPEALLQELKAGRPEALSLMGVGLRVPLERIVSDESELKIRDLMFSTLDELIARSQLGAQNLRIIDGTRMYVRGGFPFYTFYRSDASDGMTVDICNSGFESGYPVPSVIPINGRFYWLDQININSFVQQGHFFALDELDQARGRHIHGGLTERCSIEVMVQNLARLDSVEFELQVLCRDLKDRLLHKLYMPPGILRGRKILQLDAIGRKPTSSECTDAIVDFREWRSTLEDAIRKKFSDTARFLDRRINTIAARCRLAGRASPFELELDPEDEEALAGISY